MSWYSAVVLSVLTILSDNSVLIVADITLRFLAKLSLNLVFLLIFKDNFAKNLKDYYIIVNYK